LKTEKHSNEDKLLIKIFHGSAVTQTTLGGLTINILVG